ncbi:chaplin [Streptomyces chiangmaiensis]|uniref:Chaplin n=1 Tax=Streptomyces chiangmaiensis TaxID=766497 RepID=A0ABU7FJX8_9ACTN|nr:chaplin [Streptomyces chiangmaiensis]MED7824426.1 chaplin [Streptomyces chiangmaiensis]
MRQVTRKGLMTVAAATGVLAVTGGYAHADSGAHGSAGNSPGVLSGNSVQVPVHVPVNLCGNTVNVIGLLNPAAGNMCANTGGSHSGGGHSGGSHAGGHTSGSPGVGSGNHVQVPVDVPVNVCGNSVDVGGLGNPATGNHCGNTPGGGHSTTPPGGGHGTPPPGGGGGTTPPGGGGGSTPPVTPTQPGGGSRPINHPGPQSLTPTTGSAQLAQTGGDLPVGLLVPASAGALLGGVLLYRRARASM